MVIESLRSLIFEKKFSRDRPASARMSWMAWMALFSFAWVFGESQIFDIQLQKAPWIIFWRVPRTAPKAEGPKVWSLVALAPWLPGSLAPWLPGHLPACQIQASNKYYFGAQIPLLINPGVVSIWHGGGLGRRPLVYLKPLFSGGWGEGDWIYIYIYI